MTAISNIVILAMVVWRLSSLFAREDGPFRMFQVFRDWLGRMAEKIWLFQKLFITVWEGIHCVACNSVWFSAIISLVIAKSVVDWMVYTLAISTGAIIIDTVINKLNK